MSKPEDLHKAAIELAAHIKKNKPHLFTIDEEINKTENGIIGIEVRVYHGEVTDIVVTKSRRLTFKRK